MDNEKIIAVMGATGVGKSTLIKSMTGAEAIAIGHELVSETQTITSYPLNVNGTSIVLVDTPGFDDTYRSDGDILQSLVEWLTSTYRTGTRLSGIIYLHRITDVRMQGSAMRNLRGFRELCGQDFFQNVALCTTFWDSPGEDDSVLEARLSELTSANGFWTGMIGNGLKVFKGVLDQSHVHSVMLGLTSNPPLALQIQREVVDLGKSIQQTSAVSTLMNLELKRQKQEHDAQRSEERRRFEENLRLRDHKLSEDLEGMRKAYQERLSLLEKANTQLREDILTGQTSPSSPQSPGQKVKRKPITRATTVSVDQNLIVDKFVIERWDRYSSFRTYVDTNIRLLQNGKT